MCKNCNLLNWASKSWCANAHPYALGSIAGVCSWGFTWYKERIFKKWKFNCSWIVLLLISVPYMMDVYIWMMYILCLKEVRLMPTFQKILYITRHISRNFSNFQGNRMCGGYVNCWIKIVLASCLLNILEVKHGYKWCE